MTSCAVCGEKEFEVQDGYYFCVQCMTQSQDFREEEQEKDYLDSTTPLRRIATKAKDDGTKSVKRDKGRPWSSYEGFQIVLKEQVKALIKLGADPKLKDVVFHLWCSYLASTNVAFTDDVGNYHPLIKKFGRHRELYPGTIDNPDIIPYRFLKATKATKDLSKAAADKKIEQLELREALKDEEFYDEDNPFDEDEGNVDMDNMGRDLDEDDDPQAAGSGPKLIRKNYYSSVHYMNMTKTLVFCHLGLMYTNPVTTAVDIIRWVHNKELPYTSASQLIPKEMHFGPYDYSTFSTALPVSEKRMRKESGQMIRFLNLTDIPMNPVTDLINKYIVRLDLPGDLHGYVHGIRQVVHNHAKILRNYVLNYDGWAMAYIIVTLKILIGLDMSTERLLSNISQKMESLVCGMHLFVWKDWVNHINRTHKPSVRQLLSTSSNFRKLEDMDSVTASSFPVRSSARYTIQNYNRSRSEHIRNALVMPLKLLSEKKQSTSNDDSYWDSQEETTLHNGSPSRRSKTRTHDVTFRACSMKHITEPKSFMANLEQKSNTSGEKSSDEPEDSMTHGNDGASYKDYEWESPQKSGQSTDVANDHGSKDVGGLHIEDKVQFCALVEEIEKVHLRRKLDDENFGKKSVINASSSYAWLLEKCAGLTESDEEDLHHFTQLVEFYLHKNMTSNRMCWDSLVKFLQPLFSQSTPTSQTCGNLGME